MNRFGQTIAAAICMLVSIACGAQQKESQHSMTKNGMQVQWEMIADTLYCTMSAPTQGWIAVGFNTSDELTGTSLIMGAIVDGEAQVIDHYVRASGDYKPVTMLGTPSMVAGASAKETDGRTTISFSIPMQPGTAHHQKLEQGKQWTLLMAYSHEKDFQHHSIMRTSVQITL